MLSSLCPESGGKPSMSSGRIERPEVVHRLSHVLREAAVCPWCLMAFFILTQRSLGAHYGLSMCPYLTTLLTFSCLGSANQMVAEMCIGDLKSFWFSQVPLQFSDGTYGNVMSIWKSLCIICLYNCSLSQDKNSFPVIAHLLTKEIILFMYSGTLPWYLTCLIM